MIVFPFLKGRVTVTSPFGPRWGKNHNGVDYGAPVGTVFHAPVRGRIVVPAFEPGAGINIWVVGDGGDIWKCFHLSRISVAAGSMVDAGAPIAQTGNTGASTGPHAHIEYWPGGRKPVDPLPLLTEAEAAGRYPGTTPTPAPTPVPVPVPTPEVPKMLYVKFPGDPAIYSFQTDRSGHYWFHEADGADLVVVGATVRTLATGDDQLDALWERYPKVGGPRSDG